MPWAVEESTAIPGFMEPEELVWLHDQAARFQRVLEVGTWLGRSATALVSDCPGIVWTVDHFLGSPAERDSAHAEAALGDLYARAQNTINSPNIRFLAMRSLDASRLFCNEGLDMVFIDGDHDNFAVLTDLLAWYPKCRKLFCGHDADREGVREALIAFGVPYERGPGSIWFMEKI